MKRTKFSDQQIAFILRHAEEGIAVGEVYRDGNPDTGALATRFPTSSIWAKGNTGPRQADVSSR